MNEIETSVYICVAQRQKTKSRNFFCLTNVRVLLIVSHVCEW